MTTATRPITTLDEFEQEFRTGVGESWRPRSAGSPWPCPRARQNELVAEVRELP